MTKRIAYKITRFEGRRNADYRPHYFFKRESAEKFLRDISTEARVEIPNGGYLKTGVDIIYPNQRGKKYNTYSYRADIDARGNETDIKRHLQQSAAYYLHGANHPWANDKRAKKIGRQAKRLAGLI